MVKGVAMAKTNIDNAVDSFYTFFTEFCEENMIEAHIRERTTDLDGTRHTSIIISPNDKFSSMLFDTDFTFNYNGVLTNVTQHQLDEITYAVVHFLELK